MTGPLVLKSICFRCKVNKWIVDYKEGCAAKISTTSICLACEHAMKIEKLEKTMQEKDEMIKNLTVIAENLGKRVEALEAIRNEVKVVNSGNQDKENSSSEPVSLNVSSIQEKVKNIEKAIKDNMDDIADNGKAIVEIRNDMTKLAVHESGFQKAKGRLVATHSSKERNNRIETANRYAVLSLEETCLIGDSILKDQEDHFISKNKQRRKLKSFPEARVREITEEVKKLERKSSRNVIVHAGSNNLYIKAKKVSYSEPLIKELETLADCLAENTDKGIMIGLLPRLHSGNLEMSKALGINERMKKYCQQKGVDFLDLWEIFMGKKYLFKKDGIHLNTLGNMKLEKILSKTCEDTTTRNNPTAERNSPSRQDTIRDQTENGENSSFLGFLPMEQGKPKKP